MIGDSTVADYSLEPDYYGEKIPDNGLGPGVPVIPVFRFAAPGKAHY